MKNLKKIGKKFKIKHPFLWIISFLLWSLIVFYWGNFFDDSYFVKNTNVFNKLLGKTVVKITEYYQPSVNEAGTTINFEIKNIGDKDIEDLQILYTFCGLEQQKVDLEKLKLRIEETEKFSIYVPIKLNLSCSVFTDKVEADVYEDSTRNCYLDIKDQVSNVCKYCKVNFEIYGNNKKIPHDSIWYPYLDEPTNVGNMVRYLLVQYPMVISWKDGHKSQCKVLYEKSSKNGLNKSEPIYTTLFDTSTMCLRGDDIEWCKENFYGG